jgi:predicted metal-dependent peptidase
MKGLENKDKANVTMDISINHLLIDEFGFVRGLIEGWEEVCWRDTVFNRVIPPLPSFESYYILSDDYFNKGFKSVDEHKFLPNGEGDGEDGVGTPSQEIQDLIDDLTKKMAKGLPSHGDESKFAQEEIKIEKSKKPKFDLLVKKITASAIQKKKFKSSNWTTIDRRLCEIAPDIPTINELYERKCKSKYKCAFFVDNSGSCADYIERFCKTAGSLNEKIFEVDLYSFDTKVHKITKKDDKYIVVGGGGTCFNCIGKKVEETNPDIVFVITDGYANAFIPKDRQKYFWFLVEDGSKTAIANAGKIHRLSQYE